MAIKMVKVVALCDSLRYNGVPYCKGDEFEIPEHMLKEWLALGFVSEAMAAAPEPEKAAAPKAEARPRTGDVHRRTTSAPRELRSQGLGILDAEGDDA